MTTRPALILLLFLLTQTSHSLAAGTATSAQQVLEQRCMVCHGCYDAPCQLKLEAHEGLMRGASKELVYDGARLRSANLTRLFDDALTEQQWRDKGFYPVIDSRRANRGVMYRMLELKQAHPLPADGPLPAGFDFSLYRDQQCPKREEFDSFAADYPLWGMPYGFPGLNPEEHRAMTDWLSAGAPAPAVAPLSPATQQQLAHWETFLNGPDNRAKLMSRYLYEHLFLANLYLLENGQPVWFRIVRSWTPPGRNIGLIVTRRPYDNPGTTGEFYYRLQRMPVTPLAKTHMPYRLDQERLAWFSKLFLEADYEVKALPGYSDDVAGNPFKTFVDIPVDSRYRFLLGEARFTIMNFIKGPVCRGQIALNVIDDHFWVMFANPDNLDPENDAQFLAREMDNLRLPKPRTDTVIDLFSWRRYAKNHQRYLEARTEYAKQQLSSTQRKFDQDSIWDGDGHNPNAALTIFRHFDTASVVQGFVGDTPKTAWVIGYSLLERIHYLLVAGFDVYGAVAHQLESRLYMDFLRMEGESNFLMFMPPEQRTELRDHWYRGARDRIKKYFVDNSGLVARPSDIDYKTDDPKNELLQEMRQRIYGAQAKKFDFKRSASPEMAAAFTQLQTNTGAHNRFMPETSLVHVISEQRDETYSIIRNSGYSNIAQLFREEQRRLPDEDNLTVVSGVLGAYPNYFFQLQEAQLPAFARAVGEIKSEQDFAELRERYGVRRNVPWFWRLSDKLHEQYRAQDAIEYGILDYNRYAGD